MTVSTNRSRTSVRKPVPFTLVDEQPSMLTTAQSSRYLPLVEAARSHPGKVVRAVFDKRGGQVNGRAWIKAHHPGVEVSARTEGAEFCLYVRATS